MLELSQKLYHFYHMWVNNSCDTIIIDHLNALRDYGLLDHLDGFYIGIVGEKCNREHVKKLLNKIGIPHCIAIEADTGFEQITQNILYQFSLNHDGYVLYAHTKGSFNNTPLNSDWRKSMTYYNIVKWKEAIHHLSNTDAVGCHWITPKIHTHKHPFFGGTFWWTHLSYIRSLGPPNNHDRYDAEIWIGSKPHIRIHDLSPRFFCPQIDYFTTIW